MDVGYGSCAGFPSFLGLGLENCHVPTCWLIPSESTEKPDTTQLKIRLSTKSFLPDFELPFNLTAWQTQRAAGPPAASG